MKLSRKHLSSMYNMLVVLPPFDRYKMAKDVRIDFKITHSDMSQGLYEPDPHTISISKIHNKGYNDVLQTLAHEMVHLALEVAGSPHHHNHCSEFNALAAEVCNEWGWNFKEF